MEDPTYLRITKAAEVLATDTETLLHLGGQGRVQLCVDLFGCVTQMTKSRLGVRRDRGEDDAEDQEEVEYWRSRESEEEMPDGIFELFGDDARWLEQGVRSVVVESALKHDHGGWWHVDFGNHIEVTVKDLVILYGEVQRLKAVKTTPTADARTAPRTRTVPRDGKLIETIAALLAAWPGGATAVPSGKDLEKAAQSVGLSLSDDTIRKALKAAHDVAPSLPLPK